MDEARARLVSGIRLRLALAAGLAVLLLIVSLGRTERAAAYPCMDPHVFWTNSSFVLPTTGPVGRANTDGTGVNQALLQRITKKLDPKTKKKIKVRVPYSTPVGWVSLGPDLDLHVTNASGIGQSDFIGYDPVSILVTDPLTTPAGIAEDSAHIFYADRSNGEISRVNEDGTGLNTSLVTGASDPIGVAVDGNY